MMSNKERSVFERLDSIEATQSETQAQNAEILELLKKINKNNMGSICVVGPTRMDYNQVIEALEFLGSKLEELEGQKEES